MSDGADTAGVWTIVVAGGSGARYGGLKQFAELAGRRVIDHAIDVARQMSQGVVVVVPDGCQDEVQRDDLTVVRGGPTRSASVRAGLAAVPADAEIIVVHDAARPLATSRLFASTLATARRGCDAAIPTVPVTDTIRGVDGGVVDRTTLRAVQTPQAFRSDALRRAHAEGSDATDDAGLVEAAGGSVVHVDGETRNVKVTSVDDLAVAAALLGGARESQEIRVGFGYDVHPFDPDPSRRLVLGGVTFEGETGLAGHSDADVVAHAATDALLGAWGLGDIGTWFPDDDPALAGADSIDLLLRASAGLRRAGCDPVNVDCVVICDRPKLAPRRDEMQAALSDAVGAPVTVKGKRTEGVGSLGRGEGIAAHAVAMVRRQP